MDMNTMQLNAEKIKKSVGFHEFLSPAVTTAV